MKLLRYQNTVTGFGVSVGFTRGLFGPATRPLTLKPQAPDNSAAHRVAEQPQTPSKEVSLAGSPIQGSRYFTGDLALPRMGTALSTSHLSIYLLCTAKQNSGWEVGYLMERIARV